jgi:hypothetical protein
MVRRGSRLKGFKLVQLWVPDPAAPGFREAVRQTKKFSKLTPTPSGARSLEKS